MKNLLKNKLLKMFIIFVMFTLFYILIFHLDLKKLIPVYTYYGMFSLIFLTILLIILLFVFIKKGILDFDIKDAIILVLLYFFINLFVFCMVPVTLERSISVFMLNEMNKGENYTKEEIERLFIEKYIYEYEAFEKRFDEQLFTGTISKKYDNYEINNKGKLTVKIFHFIKKIYNVNGKILG